MLSFGLSLMSVTSTDSSARLLPSAGSLSGSSLMTIFAGASLRSSIDTVPLIPAVVSVAVISTMPIFFPAV